MPGKSNGLRVRPGKRGRHVSSGQKKWQRVGPGRVGKVHLDMSIGHQGGERGPKNPAKWTGKVGGGGRGQ